MPPGLAVCVVSDDAYDREVEKGESSWYGGFRRTIDYYDRKGQTHSTPAIPIMLAYRQQMKHMLDEGHAARDERHREMMEYVHDWADEHFAMFPEEGYESQTVACIENTQGIDVAATIEDVSEEYDMAFSNGYGSQLGEETFRIGHMGEHTVESVKELTDRRDRRRRRSVGERTRHDVQTRSRWQLSHPTTTVRSQPSYANLAKSLCCPSVRPDDQAIPGREGERVVDSRVDRVVALDCEQRHPVLVGKRDRLSLDTVERRSRIDRVPVDISARRRLLAELRRDRLVVRADEKKARAPALACQRG